MKTLLFYYCLLLVIVLTLGSLLNSQTNSPIPFLIFLPVAGYMLGKLLNNIPSWTIRLPHLLSDVDLYYSFIVATIMATAGLLGAKTMPQFVSAALFIPLAAFFTAEVLPKRKHAIPEPFVAQPKPIKVNKSNARVVRVAEVTTPKLDIDRRKFLKFISTAGISLFIFSLFTKKAEAAFFGSVPGPGTVSLKDTAGAQIDPAIKTPTDGYKLTDFDDTGSEPFYYGYVNRDGDWFIMKEEDNGYRYYKKKNTDGNFQTEWPNRTTLSPYGYFDEIF